MRVLVIGGSGFIGRNFLLKTDVSWECFATYQTSPDFMNFLERNKLEHVKPIYVNAAAVASITDMVDTIGDVFDACLYVCGNSDIGKSIRDPLLDISDNVCTLLSIVERLYVKRFIFISSGAVYEGHKGLVSPFMPVNPSIPYAISKLASEQLVSYFQRHTNHIDECLNLRFFGAYGPMELPRKIYTKLVKAFSVSEGNHEYTVIGDGKNYIDAMYIDDMIDGIMKMFRGNHWNRTVDFCVGSPITINDLVKCAAEVFSVDDYVINNIDSASEYTTFYASPMEAKKLFDFYPTISLSEGLVRLRDFFIAQGGL